ncbi:MAG: DNA repair protein RecN [Clostridia bacterium]|nr:DNA repair protein RecN [Clostridia bacterium]
MLKRLQVKNIALISEADIEFDEKLNILSGETGSGKSVILDSINFVLGSKADKSMIRYGEQELSVRAEFIVDENSEAVKVLSGFDIESDGNIIITRKYNTEGKGGIKINGNSVTASMLKNLTQRLVDVHGQSEHFFLMQEENQLKVIDGLAGSSCEDVKKQLAAVIAKKRKFKAEISSLGGDPTERERKLDLLNYQINEIRSADLRDGEFDELKKRQNVIANTEKILSALSAVNSIFTEDGGCLDAFTSAKHSVSGISAISEDYSKLYDRIESLAVEVADVAETVSDLADGVSFDEREAYEIDERITLIKNLKKKYGSDEKEILEFLKIVEEQAAALSDGAEHIERCTKEIEKCDGEIFALCKELTKIRKETAEKFCKSVVAELKTLNIPDASFSVCFNDYDINSADLNCADGSDKISFAFSANKGEPQKPLNKVISGGEMSRFMLAVKTQLKEVNGISTYIFDEIDSGISGFTARTVAEKFIKIAENTQILAVSHLAQVCAASDAQFLIYKTEENGKTLTKVKRLDYESKVEEIVRLTGSVNSPAAKQHALELMQQFGK